MSPLPPWFPGTRRLEGEGREVERQKTEKTTRSGRETGKMCRRRKRGRAKLAPSPLKRRKEKELLLHLGPEGAPCGQPSETRALWIKTYSFKCLFIHKIQLHKEK